jgi:hypothetical protein
MNIKFTLVLIMFLLNIVVYGQAKKPSIMVVPSKDWCQENGFMDVFDNQGVTEYVPAFERALINYPPLNSMIEKIGSEMAKDGFRLELMTAKLDELKQIRAEEAVRKTKDGAGTVAINPIDKLRQTAKTDIEFQVYWKIGKQGLEKRITEFRLVGVDTYTNLPVASTSGSGEWADAADISDPDLLREAVLSKMDVFKADLMKSFEEMFKNGRSIKLNIRVWDSWGKDLESTDFGTEGKELAEIIEDWIYDNTVEHRFGSPTKTETRMDINEIKIPIYDEKGRALDAGKWAGGLVNYLKTLGIEVKKDPVGLGKVNLFIGAK